MNFKNISSVNYVNLFDPYVIEIWSSRGKLGIF